MSRLRFRASDTSSLNRPSAGGMRPFRPASTSSSLVTRLNGPPMVTPCHKSMGRCSLQLIRASPARMFLVASRTSQSARNRDCRRERRGRALPRGRPNAVRGGGNRSGGCRRARVPRGSTAPPVPVGSGRSGRWRQARVFPGRPVSPAREERGPVNMLPSSTRDRKPARCPNAAGMRPFSPFLGSASAMTRPSGPPRSHPAIRWSARLRSSRVRPRPPNVSFTAKSKAQSSNNG